MNWRTYRYLEDRTNEASRYVAFDPKNAGTWSETFADLLMLTGAAVDSFLRKMKNCPAIAERPEVMSVAKRLKGSNWDISDFRDAYEPIYGLSQNSIEVPFGLSNFGTRTPFLMFDKGRPSPDGKKTDWSPPWWNAYNHVKHQYYDKISEATLENVIDALGALLILNVLHKDSQEYLVRQEILKTSLSPKYLLGDLKKSYIGIPKTTPIMECSISTFIFLFKLRVDTR